MQHRRSRKRLFIWFALVILFAPHQAHAQFTDARNYENTPTGVNQLEFSYAYIHANASIDTSLVIARAGLDLNQGTLSYTRYFGLFHRLMWVEAGIPVAGLNGSIAGTSIQGSTAGAADSSYSFAALLKGGPALSGAEFEHYKPTTTFGVSLSVTAPTGSYNPDQVLNLGSDRWAFKPEIALSQPFGPDQKWQVDAYANVYFFTDNTTFHGREILRQQPLPGFEGHISYSLKDSIWVSFDTRYSFRGTTFVDGIDQNNAQQNVILGSEVNVTMNSKSSLLFEFGKALVHQNGPAFTGFAVKYDYAWSRAAANQAIRDRNSTPASYLTRSEVSARR
jgi:hypothetical protein